MTIVGVSGEKKRSSNRFVVALKAAAPKRLKASLTNRAYRVSGILNTNK
jgi:hypothetical protein